VTGASDLPQRDFGALLQPRRFAVVGASDDMSSLRGRLIAVMDRHDFAAELIPISRSAAEVAGRKAYASVSEVPGDVDMAIIIVPAPHVPAVLDDCAAKGVKAAQIITSGFAEESSAGGRDLQAEIAAIAARSGMLIIGPNSEGFANLQSKLAPTFSPVVDLDGALDPPAGSRSGRVAVIGQSGGVGFSFLDQGRAKRLRFSHVVTTGNEAQVESFELVEWLVEQDEADVFILFLENVKTAAVFRRAAEKALHAGKPIIAVKVGKSAAGERAALSHTAALAGAHGSYRAMFRHYAIIEAETPEQAVDLAAGFAFMGDLLPANASTAIFTASGGAGGWMADNAAAAGLDVPVLDAATRRSVDAHLPAYGSSHNPVDATAQAIHHLGYAGLVELLRHAPGIGSVIAVASARLPGRIEEDRSALQAVRAATDKPVFFWSYTVPHPTAVEVLTSSGFPLFTNPLNCAAAARALYDYGCRRKAFQSAVPVPPVARPAALTDPGPLAEYQAHDWLRQHGLAIAEGSLARTADAAVAAAAKIDGAVALKGQARDLAHKSDVGLLALNVIGDVAVSRQFEKLMQTADAAAIQVDGVLVQAMAAPGVEVIVGVYRDPTFGPMVTVGPGGVLAELVDDTRTAPLPISPADAAALLAESRLADLLAGYRGQPAADRAALIQLIVDLGTLAVGHRDHLAEIDLNPVIVHADGAGVTVVDALIVVD
jgi:acyl-CoA synthetase (NDP forming)